MSGTRAEGKGVYVRNLILKFTSGFQTKTPEPQPRPQVEGSPLDPSLSITSIYVVNLAAFSVRSWFVWFVVNLPDSFVLVRG